jgi:mannose-1-phosphate guanylyltransferase
MRSTRSLSLARSTRFSPKPDRAIEAPEISHPARACGKNTAPAICGAAAFVAQQGRCRDVLLVLPADHLIRKTEPFALAVAEAAQLAQQGRIVTFGIVPDHPETGYGYIACGQGSQVESFVEKPDLETAKRYLANGNYLWNSGMFALTAETLLAEMTRHVPDIVECMSKAVDKGRPDGIFFRFDAKRCRVPG